ncbi:MAG TPA: DUF2232 domain-containing protein [Rhodospirillales bacterium]|nr:DUF2232 domain-containing protein [Rhodospirillales bacterium]
MSKEVMMALGAGVMSAAASMAFLIGLPGALLFAYLAPMPLLLAGFSMGNKAANIAAGSGLIAAGFIAGLPGAGLFGAFHALPAWFTIRLALTRTPGVGDKSETGAGDWYPGGWILCWLSVMAAVALLTLAVSSFGGGTGMSEAVSQYLGQVLGAMMPDMPEDLRQSMVAGLSPLFPGLIGVSWAMMTVLNGIAALALLRRWGIVPRPVPALKNLVLPPWASWLWVIFIGAALIGALLGAGNIEYMGRNLGVIMSVPFFFVGLGVAHGIIGRMPYAGFSYAVFYLLLLLFGWLAMAVAGVGLIDQWFGLRDRMSAANRNRE